MKASEIKELTVEELSKELKNHKDELLNLRIQSSTGQLENTARVKVVRRTIARIITQQNVNQRMETSS